MGNLVIKHATIKKNHITITQGILPSDVILTDTKVNAKRKLRDLYFSVKVLYYLPTWQQALLLA